jgi:cytochrome c oxidase subunit 2
MRQAIGVLLGCVGRASAVCAMVAALVAAGSGAALAQGAEAMVGAPQPWGMGLQASGGPIKDAISSFNTLVFWMMVAITMMMIMMVMMMILNG